MKVMQSGDICVNGQFGGSINRALSKHWWQKVLVSRDIMPSERFTQLNIDLSALSSREKALAKTLALYFPETNETIKLSIEAMMINGAVSIRVPSEFGRYVNLLILDQAHWIRYSNTLVLIPEVDLVYKDTLVASQTTAQLQRLTLDDQSITLRLSLSAPIGGITAALQSVHDVIPVSIDTQNINEVTIHYLQLQKLPPELWMLLVADADQKYLAQLCFTITQNKKTVHTSKGANHALL